MMLASLAWPEQLAVLGLDDDGVHRAFPGCFHDRLLVRAGGVDYLGDAARVEPEDGRRAHFTVRDADAASLIDFDMQTGWCQTVSLDNDTANSVEWETALVTRKRTRRQRTTKRSLGRA